jgi:hypothetical protein
MPRSKPMTAQELMDKLEADPEWVAKRDARERAQAERAAILNADEAELVAEIRKAGFDIDSVYDLINNTPHPHLDRRFIGEYREAYPILIRHLNLPHHERIREGIIRALTVKDGGESVESALLNHFQNEKDIVLKWVLASALRTAMPYHRRKKHPEIAAIFAGKNSSS